MHKTRHYGWRPDLPDHRDLYRWFPLRHPAELPESVDLREHCPAVYDQGDLGSCTANAIAGAIEFDRLKQGLDDFTPSRLFVYYNERAIEGTVETDSGAQIRDGIKSVVKQGACSESEWPYDISQFTVKPSVSCYQDARQHLVLMYQRLKQDLLQLRTCLAAGYPFIFGFSVYESFEDEKVARTGVAPMPGPDEAVLGGHAVVCVGYTQDAWLCRNSWGATWGQQGYFTLPLAYLTNDDLASDFWIIKSVE